MVKFTLIFTTFDIGYGENQLIQNQINLILYVAVISCQIDKWIVKCQFFYTKREEEEEIN